MSELPETTRTIPRMTQYELYESLIETLRENIEVRDKLIREVYEMAKEARRIRDKMNVLEDIMKTGVAK